MGVRELPHNFEVNKILNTVFIKIDAPYSQLQIYCSSVQVTSTKLEIISFCNLHLSFPIDNLRKKNFLTKGSLLPEKVTYITSSTKLVPKKSVND